MREGLTRLSLALVLAFFCCPLFIGLGRTDLQNDEAIYSFAVDRILETGEWLVPKSSPDENAPFLEKPPLKLWIVAAPIRLHLLPHDEFGLRFWDAVFGSVALVYVFLIGRRVAGTLCGLVAVAVLFVHAPLVLEHGLRSNNMESALLLAYCGGIYHFLNWTRAPGRRGAITVALFFTLGFLTKFVAVLFLPLVLASAVAIAGAWRRELVRGWRDWLAAGAVAAVLIAPWFVYAHVTFGATFWHVLFGEHVFKRMTVSIDPAHLHPWNHYLVLLYGTLRDSGTLAMAAAGALLLLVRLIRRPRGEEALILTWFALPMFLISSSPSKIYHYAYPFLPPVAVAAGLVPALLWRSIHPRAVAAADRLRRWTPLEHLPFAVGRGAAAYVLLAAAAGALVLGFLAAAGIPVRWRISPGLVLRNDHVLRPWIVALVLATLAGRPSAALGVFVPLVIVAILPIGAYRAMLARLPIEAHPQRDARDCVLRVPREGHPPGAYVQIMEGSFLHSYYYYFRRLGKWDWARQPDDAGLYANIWGPDYRPVLVNDLRYSEFRTHLRVADEHQLAQLARAAGVPAGTVNGAVAGISAPMVRLRDVLLILPGRYSVCSTDARASTVH